jgi:putative Ca2+/H+ antiporter (TMEM165/GDT1 family)
LAVAHDPGLTAFGSSLTAITLAELGDKTFFMALILAVRHRPRWVFVGAFSALAAVTLISLGLGYGLKELLPQGVVPWIAAALFLGFGLKLLLDAQGMAANAADDEAQCRVVHRNAEISADRSEQHQRSCTETERSAASQRAVESLPAAHVRSSRTARR